jgi:hypothetical protein
MDEDGEWVIVGRVLEGQWLIWSARREKGAFAPQSVRAGKEKTRTGKERKPATPDASAATIRQPGGQVPASLPCEPEGRTDED